MINIVEIKKDNKKSYHPSALVKVNPNRESLSTETLMPTIPSPCSVTTWPLITATRLLQIRDISRSSKVGLRSPKR